MFITISFAELSEYIKSQYGKCFSFSKTSEKEVCVSYSKDFFFKTVQVPVSISIDEVKLDAIHIIYDRGLGIDMMIAGTLSFLKAKLPELTNVIVLKKNHQLSNLLSRLSQTKSLVENL